MTKIMKTKKINTKNIITSLIAMVLIFSTKLNAQPSEAVLTLEVDPEQCVSIVQGDDCYVDVKISWLSKKSHDYCLFTSQQSKPLQCWNNLAQGQLTKEFISNENITFYLKRNPSKKIVAEEVLEMAWVYKNNGRSHASWRMF